MMKVRQKISSGFRSEQGRGISPRCAACCRVRASNAATASRPCCKGPRSSSPLFPLTARRLSCARARLGAQLSPLPFSQPRAGQPAYLGTYHFDDPA